MNVTRQLTMAAIACSLATSALAQVTSITQNTPYYIKNVTSGLVLNNGGSLTNGSPITQWSQVTSANLQWTFVATDSGYYQIKSVKSGLDIVVKNASLSNNWPLVQWSFGSALNDQWKPVRTNSHWVFFNRKSGLVINNTGGSTANGNAYTQYRWVTTSGNEQFDIFDAGGSTSTNYTSSQVLSGVKAKMTSGNQVNSKPHINTMTRTMDVNVYKVGSGVYAYTSSMAIDTDGIDADPDPDHQGQTTWTDDSGNYLGAHHVAYYVLGDYCYEKTSPCPHFYYAEHNITGLQFALIFYNGKVEGAVFGDTQGDSVTPTSDNDSRELGEASVLAATQLGIDGSGTTGGVDNGVTVVIFSGSSWVVHGSDSTTINNNAKALIQKALNTLGPQL
jgi:Ricin-type beta-trefoil lectin domain-like/Fungal chitosanase of glycosyl hydrolase group 75